MPAKLVFNSSHWPLSVVPSNVPNNYEAIAKTVVGLINESADQPMSIGIHGDWGAGKSSILLMTEKAFSDDSDVLCLRFNGWQFQGFENAKAALLEKIVIELRDARPGVEKVKEKAKDLLKRIDYLKLGKEGSALGLHGGHRHSSSWGYN